ncbi:zf-CCHC domain-containing protein [Tanacetum coccineum]
MVRSKKTFTVCQPEGFIDVDHPSHSSSLKSGIYGFLKQAPRAWYDELSTFLLQNHFFKGTIDPTLFIRRFDDDILVVQVYVDDIIFGSTHPRLLSMRDVKDTFKSTSGGAQFLGEKLVSWSLKKQDSTALSTAEAEYVSMVPFAVPPSPWMRTQITDYGFSKFNKIPNLLCDSKSAKAYILQPGSKLKNKTHRCPLPFHKGTRGKRVQIELLFFAARRFLPSGRRPLHQSSIHQNQRDLPRNTPLDRVEVLVIQNGNFYYEVEDSETKLMKKTPYELLEDDQKKKLGKNNEAKMALYNALPQKDGFTRFNAIVTSLKSLDPDYSSKIHLRKFIRALPLKWRAKVTAIEEAKNMATLPLNELVRNLKVYEMILENDSVVSKTTTKDKVKSLALKAKFTGEQTINDSDSQDGSDEDKDEEEEEAEAFNLLARNFQKFFHKGNRFGRDNRFGNGANRFGRGRGNSFGNKGGESSKQKGACYNCIIEGHFASECRNPKENKAFVGGAWSDSEDGDKHQNDATCLMAIESQEVCINVDATNGTIGIVE